MSCSWFWDCYWGRAGQLLANFFSLSLGGGGGGNPGARVTPAREIPKHSHISSFFTQHV